MHESKLFQFYASQLICIIVCFCDRTFMKYHSSSASDEILNEPQSTHRTYYILYRSWRLLQHRHSLFKFFNYICAPKIGVWNVQCAYTKLSRTRNIANGMNPLTFGKVMGRLYKKKKKNFIQLIAATGVAWGAVRRCI